ncbi:MAG: AtpZ/AtpI family protein [Phycisphaerales bacterium]|nr:MAG: AtpZ/AtpI family protein [Phycisphaerales bacterium]
MGIEFAAAVAGFVLIGYWIGLHYGNKTRGVLIGAILGLIGGGYNFIRSALQLTREMEQETKKSRGDDES